MNRNQIQFITISILCLTLLVPISYALNLTDEYSTNLDSIVAVVNDEVITASELNGELASVMARIRARGSAVPPVEALQRQVLEHMIDRRLQLQIATRLGIKVDDATLDQAVAKFAEANNMTVFALRDAVEKRGMTFERFREDTREQVQIAKLTGREVISHINVSDQEVAVFLRQNKGTISGREAVRLQHILVAIPDGATPTVIENARSKAEQLLQQLRSGADFAQVALISSDGRQALEGGDLGWMPLSQVPTIAIEAARNLPAGAISDIVRSVSGFHIFKIAEIKGGSAQEVVTQTHARHILIKTNEVTSATEAQTKLNQLRLRIKNGESFESLARSHSDDVASAINGGDLGWLNPGDTVPQFEEQTNSLTEQDVSEPFQTNFGWHIVQVLGRRQHDSTADNLNSKARESIRNRKIKEAQDLWLRRIRSESYVEIRLPEVNSNYLPLN
ncbi:hypothetical protein TI04_03590 [Achromatium sp. WMS2]|nr:hypothetical protein TI04_03590 [Achromatium sp. WMS2]